MKHVVRIASLVAAVAFAACLGTGPTPSAPSGATVLLVVPPGTEDCSAYYIGDVAFGSDTGYAVVVPYTIENNDGNCGGVTPSGSAEVFQFDLAGGSATMIGTAGMSNTMMGEGEPRIAVSGEMAEWVYGDNTGSFTLSGGGSIGTSGGTNGALGMVADGSAFYIGVTTNGIQSTQSVDDPTYLCGNNCGEGGQSNGNQPTPGTIYSLASGGTTPKSLVSAQFECATVDRCLADNPDSVFYFESSSSLGQTQISQASKMMPSVVTPVGSIPTTSFAAPVGIAASPTTVAWATSVNYIASTQGDEPEQGCAIAATDLTSMATTTLLTTQRFSCMGLAIDGTENAAYFTIVSVIRDDNNGGEELMSGIGLGRIDLATQDFTSIALGFSGPTSGPRRVHPMDDSVYAIDPQVLGRIAKSAFVGQHDFAP